MLKVCFSLVHAVVFQKRILEGSFALFSMSSRRKDGGFPRRKHGNCNKPLRQAVKEVDGRQDKIGDLGVGAVAGPSSRGSERPPPGLRGKEIGLWYRNRQVKINKKNEDERTPEVKLPREKLDEIEALLLSVGPVGNMSEDMMVDGAFKNNFFDKIRGTFEENMTKQMAEEIITPDPVMDREMKNRLQRKVQSSRYNELLEFRKKLPCYKKKEELVRIIAENQLVVLSGETGCGKTTQIAQYVLDDAILGERGSQCSILCTQPRRISAISVAERVAVERDEQIGDSVGYQIRLEKVLPKQKSGSILFVTTGILLQWIQSNPTLSGISHLFIDEVHERDILCDFVITCLKQIIVKRPNLKVILMSATLNAERFSAYFGGAPCIHIPGFTFPVEEIYLDQVLELTKFRFGENVGGPKFPRGRNSEKNSEFEHVVLPYVRNMEQTGQISRNVATQLKNPLSEKLNIDLIEAIIHHICLNEKDGAILVFVPGLSDIQKINSQLLSRKFFNNSRFVIIPLHSILPTVSQKQIFTRPPQGVRKIIIATNIAETSITIDDVVYVVDSGFIKMKNFNMDLNVTSLDSQWVSVANARQRRGRAGRVEAGKCYKLYTSVRENLFEQFPLPEMQRTRLEEVVLQVKTLQLGKAAPFLETVLDPPDKMAVELSLQVLRNLNALDADERLTPLGFHLAKLPLDPQTGKMILMAAIFGCVDPVLSIAAALNFKDPFMIPLGKEHLVRRIKEDLARGEKSDHYVLAAAIQEWETACRNQDGRGFANEHFLSGNTLSLLKDMKGQFARHLHEMMFLSSPNPKDVNGNVNSRNVELVKAVVCSGLYPNIAMIKSVRRHGPTTAVILKTATHPRVELHPKSVCSKIPSFESPFLAYHLMIKSSAIFVHDVTMVSPWALLFFGERLDVVEFDNTHGIRVDDLIKVKCYKKTGMLIKKLRGQLDWILASAISNPGVVDWNKQTKESMVLRAIVQLITAENEEKMMLMDEWE